MEFYGNASKQGSVGSSVIQCRQGHHRMSQIQSNVRRWLTLRWCQWSGNEGYRLWQLCNV